MLLCSMHVCIQYNWCHLFGILTVIFCLRTTVSFKCYVTLFSWEFDPTHPPTRNVISVEPYTTLFPGKAESPVHPPPLCVT